MRDEPPPAEGGELKNIRRCLKPKKADPTPLASTVVASATAIAAVVKGAFPIPTSASGWSIAWWLAWVLIPSILAAGSVAVSYMRYASAIAAQDDDHLKAAQEDADRLITMQALMGRHTGSSSALVNSITYDA
jgi:hypothetical protein